MECTQCDGKLIYEADISAPGYGKSYVCGQCKETYWVVRGTAVRFADIENPEDIVMDPSDCF